MPIIRQTSFGAGELSPYLWGRSDLEVYGKGARRLRNFVVTPQGAAPSRPGTRFVVQAKTPDIVLVPYIVSDSVSYVLELGEYYLRVHTSSGYTGTELATPYRAGDLPALQWAQAGNVLNLTHPSYSPKEFIRYDSYPYSIVLKDAQIGPPGDTSYTPMQAYFVKADGSPAAMPALVDNPATTLFVLDAAHPAREWRWKVTALVKNNRTGELAETLPRDITQYFDGATSPSLSTLPTDNEVVLYEDRNVLIRHPAFAVPIPKPTDWTVIGLNYYRGRGNAFGFVGTTRYAQDFLDVGEEPDYLTPPPRGDSPWQLGDFPAAVAFFQQRRFYGGSAARPGTWWASAIDSWGNYDAPARAYAGQPLEATLAGRKRERIRWLVPGRRLFIGTDTAIWSVGGVDGALDYDTIEQRLEDEVGSTSLMPLVLEGTVLYARVKGRGVRALAPTQDGGYRGVDVSTQAEHLFFGGSSREVRSWAWQEDPWGIAWLVRNDGALLSLTRTADGWAWARHDTAEGDDTFLSVCSVPEANEDGVYLAVRRGDYTFIERLERRTVTETPADAASVDSAVRYTGAPTDTFTGLSHLEGREVWVVATDNPPFGPLTVTGGQVVTSEVLRANDGSNLEAYIGLAFECDVETLDAAPGQARHAQKTVVSVGFEVDNSIGLQVGQDEEHLVDWQQRTVSDGYFSPTFATAHVVVKVKGAWDKTGRAFLRQSKPLRVTLLGLTRNIEMGGE